MSNVRILTDSGIVQFEAYLAQIKAGAVLPVPKGLLNDSSTSATLSECAVVEERGFASRLEAGTYLVGVLRDVELSNAARNRGMWTWLALFYFEHLCPTGADGARNPRRVAHYIFDPAWNRFYRHLLAFPFWMCKQHPELCRVLLATPVHQHGDIAEQCAGRIEVIRNPGLLQAVDMLYWDAAAPGGGAPKLGVASKEKRGGLRRFGMLIRQFDVTFDLSSLTGPALLSLLPKEFDAWK